MVINVWASWCAPCRAEADDLVRASRRLDEVSFVGINTRDDPSAAAAFVRSNGITYPSLLDESGSELLKFYGLYNIKALPTTMVVDSEGRIAAIVTDAITETTLVDVVQEVSEA
jgi:thiol-disulfide isomerase/thioredoxin